MRRRVRCYYPDVGQDVLARVVLNYLHMARIGVHADGPAARRDDGREQVKNADRPAAEIDGAVAGLQAESG